MKQAIANRMKEILSRCETINGEFCKYDGMPPEDVTWDMINTLEREQWELAMEYERLERLL